MAKWPLIWIGLCSLEDNLDEQTNLLPYFVQGAAGAPTDISKQAQIIRSLI